MRRAVLLFVKYPQPGRVKTRIAQTAGAERAATIYRELVQRVLAPLPADVPLLVVFDPPDLAVEIARWLEESSAIRPAGYLPQSHGDLGQRLEHAFAIAFGLGYEQLAVIGSDCVEITPAHFDETWQALAGHDVVAGPSHDGGYYLLALRRPLPTLFRGIAWSTPQVLVQTLQIANELGLKVFQLARLHDIDTEEDWKAAQNRLQLT